jgi:hypothetical protein
MLNLCPVMDASILSEKAFSSQHSALSNSKMGTNRYSAVVLAGSDTLTSDTDC